MNDALFQNWIERAAGCAGVFACGVLLSNNSYLFQTRHEAFPEARISELLQCMTELASTLRNNRLGSSRLCCVFENGQIHCARCADGAIALLATTKNPDIVPAVDELFTNLLATDTETAGLPEQPL